MKRKKIVCLVMMAAMLIGSFGVNGNSVFASDVRSDTWAASKTPGNTGNPTSTCSLTYYAGTVKFYTYTLSGASYVAAKCQGTNCTINNSNAYVARSKESTTDYTSFKVINCSSDTMKFKVTVYHNADVGNLVTANGKICY